MSTSIRTTAAQSLTSVLGTVATTASVLTSTMSSLDYLARSGEVKAKLFHDRVKTNAINNDWHYRQVDKARSVERVASHLAEIQAKLADPAYKALYEAAQADLEAHIAQNP